MVFQHFMLIPVMTVAENLVLGDEPRSGGFLDVKAARRRTQELSERYGLKVDPDARVEDISVGMQQRVEILRALDRGARVLVLDEPTAVLTAQETGELMSVLAELKAGGTSIVFISHKLPEVLKVADRVTVLRRGKSVGTIDTAGADEPMLARMMVGRDVVLRVEKEECKPGDVALEVSDLHVLDDRGLPAVDGVTLQVRAGEIVALAGIDGNGQSELVEAVTGLRHDRVRPGPRLRPGHHRRRPAPRAPGGRRAHRGGPPAARPRARLRPHGEPRAARLPDGLAVGPAVAAPDARVRQAAHRRVRRPRGDAAARSRARSRAATSRRSSSPARSPATPRRSSPPSPRAAWTSARSSSCTAACSPSATPARRSCSSRSSSRRSATSPTASSSIYAGRIVGELPPSASDEELGLLMTGGTAAPAA